MIFNVVPCGNDLSRDLGLALHIAAHGEERSPNFVAREEFEKPRSGGRRTIVERESYGFPARVATPARGGENRGRSPAHRPGGPGRQSPGGRCGESEQG